MKRKPLYEAQNAWLQSKYGNSVRPWEIEMMISPYHDGANTDGLQYPIKIDYRYEKISHNGKEKERLERTLEIQKPETYKAGVLTQDGQVNTNKVWIVNGRIDKVDGNFIQKNFKMTKVGETGIQFGQVPYIDQDYVRLKSNGV